MGDLLSRFDGGLPSWFWPLAAVLAAALVLWLFIRSVAGVRTRRHRAQHARIAIVDVEEVDGRRRLVLLRRDNVEHLVMIGGPGDVVIETGIGDSGPAAVRASSPPTRPQTTTGPGRAEPVRTEPRVATALPDLKPASAIPTPSAPIASASTVAAPVVGERKEPTVSQPPTARTAELDGEIQELLEQMSRDRRGPNGTT